MVGLLVAVLVTVADHRRESHRQWVATYGGVVDLGSKMTSPFNTHSTQPKPPVEHTEPARYDPL